MNDIIKDKEIQTIKKESISLVEISASVKVTTEKEALNASEFVTGINNKIKSIEEMRLSFTKPLNESLGKINSTFRELSAPLANAKMVITRKIMDWRRAEQEKIEKEEARRRAIQESHAERGHEVNAPVIMQRPETKIGNVQVRKIWKFKVVDQTKVPERFKIVDSSMVINAMREGVREIAGIEIYQEEISAIR